MAILFVDIIVYVELDLWSLPTLPLHVHANQQLIFMCIGGKLNKIIILESVAVYNLTLVCTTHYKNILIRPPCVLNRRDDSIQPCLVIPYSTRKLSGCYWHQCFFFRIIRIIIHLHVCFHGIIVDKVKSHLFPCRSTTR